MAVSWCSLVLRIRTRTASWPSLVSAKNWIKGEFKIELGKDTTATTARRLTEGRAPGILQAVGPHSTVTGIVT